MVSHTWVLVVIAILIIAFLGVFPRKADGRSQGNQR